MASRLPAGANGLVGLKPSRDRVFAGPLPSDVGGLAVEGALTRTVRDSAVALAADHPSALTALRRPAGSFADGVDQEPGRLRIARCVTPMTDAVPDADCVAAYEKTGAALAAAGHELCDIELSVDPAFVDAFIVLWAVSAASIPVPPDGEPLLRPVTRWLRDRGRRVSGTELVAARGAVETFSRRVVAQTAAYDAVLSPTARPADEATLLRLAAQLESELDWANRTPPIWR